MLTSAELVWLLAGVAKGDHAAFERLYRATRAKLYGVVLRILQRPDLAGEALQDAYLRIWTKAARFDPGRASPITWMVAIARNRAIDVARQAGEIVVDEAEAAEVASDDPDPLGESIATEALKRLLACLGRLEADRQRMVLLAYFSGVDRAGLAREFDRPVNTIKTQLRRALADLRECLGNE
ncbi:sigma-70 family RNA polymerase sigma factor [Rhodoplanes roseus]|uniref:RNA polymerase subunit sigma-70 n=1 Tax=Rhodoplanes roseus TaxID=29409 RepID=A0A327KJ41_9BRAD|nr:sigma-70 family RNA polymerase sigma factor [Rhodoplanes roseus]RAI38104.1 RNA polymerase subunit sigma-70 [Rhodoplanes roseus]